MATFADASDNEDVVLEFDPPDICVLECNSDIELPSSSVFDERSSSPIDNADEIDLDMVFDTSEETAMLGPLDLVGYTDSLATYPTSLKGYTVTAHREAISDSEQVMDDDSDASEGSNESEDQSGHSETDLEASARSQTLHCIENMVLDLLHQIANATEALSRGEQFSDVSVELADRSKTTGHEKYAKKYIKFPGNRPGASGSYKLACLGSLLNYMHHALSTDTEATKRDIYYRDVKLFKKQSVVDGWIDDLAATFDVRRSDLNVRASAKGLFSGACLRLILHDGAKIYGHDREGSLIPSGKDVATIELDEGTSWILVVEKEAVFQTLCQEGFASDDRLPGPGVIVTGKGYPDISTRELVHMLAHLVPESIPCMALMDADPHGLDILSVYKYGSDRLRHESHSLEASKLKWIGLRMNEITSGTLGIHLDSLLPLSKHDRRKALAMLKRPVERMPKRWRRELQTMLHLQRKAEIEVISEDTNITVAKELPTPQKEPLALISIFDNKDMAKV